MTVNIILFAGIRNRIFPRFLQKFMDVLSNVANANDVSVDNSYNDNDEDENVGLEIRDGKS